MKKLLPFLLGRMLNFLSWIAPRYAGKIGFRIFCFPFRGPLQSYHHKFLNTAEKSTFDHNGVTIQLYKWGSGNTKILFLHGWQSHTFRWKNYIESFSQSEYTCYAIDAPGHGLSKGSFLTVPLYSEVIEKVIIQNGPFDSIIGHSLGAFTTLYTLHRLPLLPVKKLVLLAPPGDANEFTQFYQETLGLTQRTMKRVRRHFEDVIGERVEFFNAAKFAISATQPGLIIHDEEDQETHVKNSEAIHGAWNKSRLHITRGLGHNLKSPAIVEEVASFVKNPAMVEV
jgi:pimeloyl-ACP methyl ester carboxylesterase